MAALVSDTGMVRNLNEDYGQYYEGPSYKIYVVADGMGGHNAGEVASKMAAEGIVDYVKSHYDESNVDYILREAIEKVNEEIFFQSVKSDSLNGMGTTITACLITGDLAKIANVGDSSCYGINNDEIVKLTKDHSLVQELLDLGTITEEEAFNHPKKNIITRAVGTSNKVDIDLFSIEKGKYNLFMLCSDGLTNEILKNDIIQVINDGDTLETTCRRLVDIAKFKGGRDNITVLLFGGEI